ncbi:MAG: hypothetical protein HC892_08090 [Saprospiraceae bacterium]|nr:hypothetical protein [Saprospiraceae bacterium]
MQTCANNVLIRAALCFVKKIWTKNNGNITATAGGTVTHNSVNGRPQYYTTSKGVQRRGIINSHR